MVLVTVVVVCALAKNEHIATFLNIFILCGIFERSYRSVSLDPKRITGEKERACAEIIIIESRAHLVDKYFQHFDLQMLFVR